MLFCHSVCICPILLFHRDPADKLIRHRACSLRDNAYALIKAELDSDFEDKCREISKSRRVVDTVCNNEAESKNPSKPDLPVSATERADKKDTGSPSHSLVVNGRRYGNSRKRRIPAWARGYVKKVHKKKKIAFDESVTTPDSKVCLTSETTSIDLEKFQEFETEANSVLNGHVALFDNSDSENDSQNENSKDAQGTQSNNVADQRIEELENMEISYIEEDKNLENSGSNSSSRRESMDELSFAIESDSSPARFEENEKLAVDKNELESAWQYTVNVTKDSPVEVLCDIYVQLSRCAGKYAQSYDRKSLPKVHMLYSTTPLCIYLFFSACFNTFFQFAPFLTFIHSLCHLFSSGRR